MRRPGSLRTLAGRILLGIALLGAAALPAAAQASPSITIDPDCGPESTGGGEDPNYEIVVQGNGFEPGDDVEIYFAGERQDDPDSEDVVAAENGTFGTVIRPAPRPAGSYEVDALQRHGEGSVSQQAKASFVVPCPDASTTTTQPGPGSTTTTVIGPDPTPSPSPTKKPRDKDDEKRKRSQPRAGLETKVGPPGSVVQVRGRGFPRGRRIVLDWDRGLGSVTVRTDGKGRFDASVLVFPNDVLGVRRLTVKGRGLRPARLPFLVVAGSADPPGFGNR